MNGFTAVNIIFVKKKQKKRFAENGTVETECVEKVNSMQKSSKDVVCDSSVCSIM